MPVVSVIAPGLGSVAWAIAGRADSATSIVTAVVRTNSGGVRETNKLT